jgi:hypothetical protein
MNNFQNKMYFSRHPQGTSAGFLPWSGEQDAGSAMWAVCTLIGPHKMVWDQTTRSRVNKITFQNKKQAFMSRLQ